MIRLQYTINNLDTAGSKYVVANLSWETASGGCTAPRRNAASASRRRACFTPTQAGAAHTARPVSAAQASFTG
jgi:hypothetical protein